MSGRCFNLTGNGGGGGEGGLLHIFKTQFPHSQLIFQHRWSNIAEKTLEKSKTYKDPGGKKK